MATALLRHLVLDVHGRGAVTDQRAHGARNIEGAAEAGIHVHQQGQIAHRGDAAHVGEHVFQGADAEVRHAQRIGGHAAAGQVNGLVPGGLGHARGEGIDGADHLQGRLLAYPLAEYAARMAWHSRQLQQVGDGVALLAQLRTRSASMRLRLNSSISSPSTMS